MANPGASYSFGCSYSAWTAGCKFRKSTNPNPDKYRVAEQHKEDVEMVLADLADMGALFLQSLAPEPFNKMTEFSVVADSCRIGHGELGALRKPFSGTTVNLDFSAHNHKDLNNMKSSAIVVSSFRHH